MNEATMRIGEVARRTGVSVETLRAWERRYELLDPDRTDGGHRLYREDDVARVLAVQQLVDQGWSVAAAARDVRSGPVGSSGAGTPATTSSAAAGLTSQLEQALTAYDVRGVERVLDDTLARYEPAAAADLVLAPVLRWVGQGWQDEPAFIAREHVATNALRTRLLRLLRTTPSVRGRTCVAAAPAGELHDLGLLLASVALSEAGWRVHFLGALTPTAALDGAIAALRPRLVLTATLDRRYAEPLLEQPPRRTEGDLVVLGGDGFGPQDVERWPRTIHHDGDYRDLPDVVEQALGPAAGG